MAYLRDGERVGRRDRKTRSNRGGPIGKQRFAWATNRWNFIARLGDQVIELPLRCTCVLEKREAGWVIARFHKSVGMAG